MSAHWYPEGYSYPTFLPIYPARPQLAAQSSNQVPSRKAHATTSGSQVVPSASSSRRQGVPPQYSNSDSTRSSDIPEQSATFSSRSRPRGSAVKQSSTHSGPGQFLYQQPDLVDGVDYFKIGDVVRIRRWCKSEDRYTKWMNGTVLRPVLVPAEEGGTRRTYDVSYTDPHSGEVKERCFAPYLQEITTVEPDVPRPSIIPQRDKSNLVFARISTTPAGGTRGYIWTPAVILTAPSEEGRVRIRILAGTARNRELADFKLQDTAPYTRQVAAVYKQQGHEVDETDVRRI